MNRFPTFIICLAVVLSLGALFLAGCASTGQQGDGYWMPPAMEFGQTEAETGNGVTGNNRAAGFLGFPAAHSFDDILKRKTSDDERSAALASNDGGQRDFSNHEPNMI